MRRHAAVALLIGGVVYGLFALACFRLALEHDHDAAVSVGEGAFTVLGAAALFVALARRDGQAAIVALGTVPLVGWFLATPWNSGPPFLVASLIAPMIAASVLLRGWRLRLRGQRT